MPIDSTFAPYRLAEGVLPAEGALNARLEGAEPLVIGPGLPLPPALLGEALASLDAGRASSEAEACRSADGGVAGSSRAPLACLASGRHQRVMAEAVGAALQRGFAGAVFERLDAPLAGGLLGAGFCPDCQRELQQRLARKYGEQFQPLDFLGIVRDAVAGASGAITLETLPFGRDFWRFRHEALERSVRALARAGRDAARQARRPFTLGGWFEAVGPSQLAAARHLDAAVFPIHQAGVPLVGRFELLRGALGRRGLAVALPDDAPPAAWLRLASLAAPWGIGLAGIQPGGEAGAVLAGIRALMRGVAARGGAPAEAAPHTECAVLYSAEADLWSGGRHRHAVELALEALAGRHIQVTVAFRPSAVPLGTPLLLADASPLSRLEDREVGKRRAAGSPVLAFPGPDQDPHYERAADAHVPAARRALVVSAPVPLLAALRTTAEAVDVHLATSWPERATRARVRLPLVTARGARKAIFRSSAGTEETVRLSRSGEAVTAELPAFTGYAVLSPEV
jgi:hypothetical protein